MSLGTDALALVKDVKKFEAQLAKLAKAEKSAGAAIDRANRQADQIIADARATEQKAARYWEEAKIKMASATAVVSENDAKVLAAKEESQRANAHEGRIAKAKQKLEQDSDTLAGDVAAFQLERKEFQARLAEFNDTFAALSKTLLG